MKSQLCPRAVPAASLSEPTVEMRSCLAQATAGGPEAGTIRAAQLLENSLVEAQLRNWNWGVGPPACPSSPHHVELCRRQPTST